ncbi:MAG: hypothetical protein R3337_10355 [Gammaproteobacteria bacterium]|nr:hypothetical protein [Gammaproteobacteria bacterium]
MNHLHVDGEPPRQPVADDHGLALELELQPPTRGVKWIFSQWIRALPRD